MQSKNRYLFKNLSFIFFLSILFSSSAVPCHPLEDFIVSGTITDAERGKSLEGVFVESPLVPGKFSNYEGYFSLKIKKPAGITLPSTVLSFSKEGYYPCSMEISLLSRSIKPLSVKMKPRLATLEGKIVSCFYDGKNHVEDSYEGMVIRLQGLSHKNWQVIRTAEVDKNGKFIFRDIPLGSYRLMVGKGKVKITLEQPGEKKNILITGRYCMRDEFHKNENYDSYDHIFDCSPGTAFASSTEKAPVPDTASPRREKRNL